MVLIAYNLQVCISQDTFYKHTKSNTVVIKLKTHVPSSNPCHIQPIAQRFSMDDGPFITVDVNLCSGSCFSINVPSNNTFVKSLCQSCQESNHAFKQIVYPLKNGNFTLIKIKTALGCKCKTCTTEV